ncbi:unnamed protein product [Darwinula stevensoni]|uniref:Ribokinase n=1 Tax=Darwinula stevensoni TaxID=69355 RepID=A0A7R8XFQ8_9CRUS|nr:unnamed protein product [Darwinula stevensoni]CAG0895303.1 unnamed protein product [Darwinula stevensoni]
MAETQDIRFDVVALGGAIYDIIGYVGRFPEVGETVNGTGLMEGFGGKGANQAVACAKLGGRTAFIGRVGDDGTGRATVENFRKWNLDASRVQLTPGASSATALIHVERSGANKVVVVNGANDHVSEGDVQDAADVIEASKVLVCTLEVPKEAVRRALEIAARRGITSVLNAAPEPSSMPVDLFSLPSIVNVNETEAAQATGLKVETVEDAKDALRSLLKDKGCKGVILTLGENGCLYGHRDEPENVVHVTTESVSPIDTTGAGDSFNGAFAFFTACHSELPMRERLSRACAVATRSVLSHGTQSSFSTRDQLPHALFL